MTDIQITRVSDSEVPQNIARGVVVMQCGDVTVTVTEHGAINMINHRTGAVTSNRTWREVLVPFYKIIDQRGGIPLHGQMPRVHNEFLALPGEGDIHGVWAGMPWQLLNVNEGQSYIDMHLSGRIWKSRIADYYLNACLNYGNHGYTVQSDALERFLHANLNRYRNNKRAFSYLQEKTDELRSILTSRDRSSAMGRINTLVEYVVNYSYPGELDIVRRVQIEFPFGEQVPVISDTVSLKNVSTNSDAIHAAGFHAYWAAQLEEIMIDKHSTGVDRLEVGYDENLNDVQVRMLNQKNRLGRVIAIFPTHGFQNPNINQIIYHDELYHTEGGVEVAIENVAQRGGIYPLQGRTVKINGGEDIIGMQTIIMPTGLDKETRLRVESYLQEMQAKLSPKELIIPEL